MTKLLDLPFFLEQRRSHGIADDFTEDQDAAVWVKTGDASSTNTVGDAVGGILAITPGAATDNDECYVESPNETFLFADNKPLIFEARVQFTEANTDDANIFVGVVDAVAANLLVDNGAGPKTTASGAAFYKVDGGTVWRCWTSKSTTQTINTTGVTAGGASYQTLRIEVQDFSSTECEVTFFIDGVQCRDATTNDPIVHRITMASATEMQIGLGVKNGDTNIETLNVDYVAAYQLR